MSWTSHDQFFGWTHSFKLNRNNYLFGGRTGINDKPYPVIVNTPTFPQVVNNWNRADTGLVFTFFLAGLLIAKRVVAKDIMISSLIEKRSDYRRVHRIIVAFGVAFALRNSCYRL
jgi:NADH-ubiquinone oxidoreductase complex I, 21 kDa subunit